jgi:hypothetical protein
MLRDDGSRYGTNVVRNGETIPVHTATSGVRLHDGDEIYFGSAHARVRIA